MSIKSLCTRIFAYWMHWKTKQWTKNPAKTQQKVFKKLIKQAQQTQFGKEHHFDKIKTFNDFSKQVPISDYEDFRPYIEKIIQGQSDILWPDRPLYFAKTSGTTSGVKYIPITRDSMPYHIQGARNAILSYVYDTGNTQFIDGKMIFLQGSPILKDKNGIKIGRLSGISAHYVPSYLQKNRLPSWETNCIEDWEQKVDAIVQETKNEPMSLISGIPAWVQMYFERLKSVTGKSIGELFPNFNLFIYGGVNYEPYRASFENLIGRKVDSIELFPASEGFFAYQDKQNQKGMLLLLNAGIFYEFIKVEEFNNPSPRRYTISEVELGQNYVLIISTNAGLWGYNIGDTVQFVSLSPYRIIVSGRIKHFISAFGEHVIAKEVEQALTFALQGTSVRVFEFTVAPQVNPLQGELPYHQWFIEFDEQPLIEEDFAKKIDEELQRQNIYYADLRQGNILQQLKIVNVPKGIFARCMKQDGKLGGQNKLPRLTNDRVLAKKIEELM